MQTRYETAPIAVTDQTRNEIWAGYHECVFAAAYYRARANGFIRRHKVMSFAIFALGGGTVVPSLWTIWAVTVAEVGAVAQVGWAPYAMASAGIALAVATLVEYFGAGAVKATTAQGIVGTCERLTQEWANLLSAVDSELLDDRAARGEMERLSEIVNTATAASAGAHIQVSDNDRRTRKAATEAARYLQSRYTLDRASTTERAAAS